MPTQVSVRSSSIRSRSQSMSASRASGSTSQAATATRHALSTAKATAQPTATTACVRAHQPGVRARVGQPHRGLARRGDRGQRAEQHGGAGARQAERRGAERPPVHRAAAHPHVDQQAEQRGRDQRVQRRQQQRDRQPPGGEQVPPHADRLAETSGRLHADRAAGHQRAEQRQVTTGQRGARSLPAHECQVSGEHAGDIADKRKRFVEQRDLPWPPGGATAHLLALSSRVLDC